MRRMLCVERFHVGVAMVNLVFALHGHAAVTYGPPIDLGSFGLGQDQAWAYCVNNYGQVVGEAYAPDGLKPFLWTAEEGMREIRDTVQDPLYQFTAIEHARCINDLGQVVGWNDEDGAVLYEGGDVREMVTAGTYYALPYSINNVGRAVGERGGLPAVFDIAAGFVAEIRALQGSEGAALSLNEEGQIVGYYEVSQGDRPFLCEGWTPAGGGTAVDLGTFGCAWDINSEGQIVGETKTEGFLYEKGALRNIGGRAACAVNDVGQIVGYSGSRAVLWTPEGSMVDIHPEGWQSSKAKDINNRGWVVGDGKLPDGRNRAFLLVPAADVLVRLKLTPGGLKLIYQVPPEVKYELQASTDLLKWAGVTDVVYPVRCVLDFLDPSALTMNWGFYRLKVSTE